MYLNMLTWNHCKPARLLWYVPQYAHLKPLLQQTLQTQRSCTCHILRYAFIFYGCFFSITWGLVFIACVICVCALTIFSLPAYLCVCVCVCVCVCALTSFSLPVVFLCVCSHLHVALPPGQPPCPKTPASSHGEFLCPPLGTGTCVRQRHGLVDRDFRDHKWVAQDPCHTHTHTHTHSTHTVPPECHEVDYVVSDLMSQKNSRATKNMRYTISRWSHFKGLIASNLKGVDIQPEYLAGRLLADARSRTN
jgi:hypothetical protein